MVGFIQEAVKSGIAVDRLGVWLPIALAEMCRSKYAEMLAAYYDY